MHLHQRHIFTLAVTGVWIPVVSFAIVTNILSGFKDYNIPIWFIFVMAITIIINRPNWSSREKKLAKALRWSQEQGYDFGLKYVGALGDARSMSCAIIKLILLPILSELVIYICFWFGNQIGMQVVPDKATADLISRMTEWKSLPFIIGVLATAIGSDVYTRAFSESLMLNMWEKRNSKPKYTVTGDVSA